MERVVVESVAPRRLLALIRAGLGRCGLGGPAGALNRELVPLHRRQTRYRVLEMARLLLHFAHELSRRDAPHLEGVAPPEACIRADGGHGGGGVLESPRIPVAVILYVLATPAIAARHRLTVTFLGTCAFASCQATATDVYAQRSRGDIRSCLSCSF